MYSLVLILHSWLRWAAVVAGVGATLAALTGRQSVSRPDSSDRWGLLFLITMDLQFLIGLLLYFVLSPTTAAIRQDFAAAMRDPGARFWAVEHLGTMLVAVVMVHVGRVLARKASTPGAKRTPPADLFRCRHRRHAGGYSVARNGQRPPAVSV